MQSNIGNYPALVNRPDTRYAVSLGSGLSFEAGQPWNHKYTAALEGRLVPITVPFLLDKGLLSQGVGIGRAWKSASEL